MIKRAQNRIAQSRWSLPVTAIYGLLLFLISGMASQGLWLQLLILVASTVMLVILNNHNSLIRIYSRMVSCSFCVVVLMSPFLFSSINIGIAQLAFIFSLNFILRAFQDKQAVGWVFYAFVAIGVASVFYVELLWLVPILWILLTTNVLAMSLRTFIASILGVALPYWFLSAYYLLIGNPQAIADHFEAMLLWQQPFDFSMLDIHRGLTFLFVAILGIIGSVHFVAYSYQDKIRTRMIFEMFITLEICLLVLLILQPQHFDVLLSLLLTVVSPLIGHFLSLTHSKLSNITFFTLIIAALALTVFNIWMP